MEHSHSHHHGYIPESTGLNTAYLVGISLNLLFVIIEVVAGLFIHSLSLLSDAGHNLADVGALVLSLVAFRLLKVKSNEKYTYGFGKTSILVALFNAVILLVSVGAITYEAIHRLIYPEQLPGLVISAVAAIGIAINFLTAIMFKREKDKDMNVKSAYLHLLSDAVVALGIVIGGIAIYYLRWYWLDPVLSIIIVIVILAGTWRLLKDSLRLSLDGVPSSVDIDQVRSAALGVAGVKGIHHIHIWALSTRENAMTAHLVIAQEATVAQEEEVKQKVKHELEHRNIQHATLETERENNNCETEEH